VNGGANRTEGGRFGGLGLGFRAGDGSGAGVVVRCVLFGDGLILGRVRGGRVGPWCGLHLLDKTLDILGQGGRLKLHLLPDFEGTS
jgi:hypothetical protein